MRWVRARPIKQPKRSVGDRTVPSLIVDQIVSNLKRLTCRDPEQHDQALAERVRRRGQALLFLARNHLGHWFRRLGGTASTLVSGMPKAILLLSDLLLDPERRDEWVDCVTEVIEQGGGYRGLKGDDSVGIRGVVSGETALIPLQTCWRLGCGLRTPVRRCSEGRSRRCVRLARGSFGRWAARRRRPSCSKKRRSAC